MIKVVSLLYRNPSLTAAEFREYWETTHVPLIKSLLPSMTHYTGSFPIDAGGPDRPGSAIECDAIVELGFPDIVTMEREMGSERFNSAEREASSARLMQLDKTKTILVEEMVVPLP